jgi:pSer/pThr/pTyr-binding forkhead associated (FHA) protein
MRDSISHEDPALILVPASASHFSPVVLTPASGPYRLGRGEEGCIDHPTVSRSHAEIRWLGGVWILVDLQSSNGTYLNDRLVAAALLHDQAEIRLGRHAPLIVWFAE